MYLFKLELQNNTEPYSLYCCMEKEVDLFNQNIEKIENENADKSINIAVEDECFSFKNIDELKEKFELKRLTHDEYETLCTFHIGNDECTAQKVFDSVCDMDILFEQSESMGMEMT